MKHKISLLIGITLLALKINSQTITNDVASYLDESKSICSIEKHKYVQLISDYKIEKEIYDFSIFYKSGKLESKGKTKDKNSIILEGNLVEFYENGNRKRLATYSNNQTIGKVFEWYENGNIKSEIEIIRKKKEKITKIIHFWDENNIQKVIDGEGEFIEIEDIIEVKRDKDKPSQNINSLIFSKGTIKKYLKEGTWKGLDENNNSTFIEEYREGQLISGISTDKFGIIHNYTEANIFPTPKKGFADFYKYIGEKFSISNEMNGKLNGKFRFTFIVSENGKIEEIKPLDNDIFGVNDATMKLILDYGNWKPGIKRGIPVRVSYLLPLTLMF